MGKRNKRDIYRREAIKLVDCFTRAASTQYPKHLREAIRLTDQMNNYVTRDLFKELAVATGKTCSELRESYRSKFITDRGSLRDGMREVAQKLREEFHLPSHDNIPSSRQRQYAQVEAKPRLRGSQHTAMAHQQH